MQCHGRASAPRRWSPRCGQADDGSPTAAENEQLNNISEVLDTSADSLVPPRMRRSATARRRAETGELPVVANEVVNDAAGERAVK